MMLIHSAWLAAAEYLKRGIQVDELHSTQHQKHTPRRARAAAL